VVVAPAPWPHRPPPRPLYAIDGGEDQGGHILGRTAAVAPLELSFMTTLPTFNAAMPLTGLGLALSCSCR